MIRSIEIQRVRGIREGRIDDLTPLTILVGPNGCGKSTILDALLMGASPVPGDAIGRAVRRRFGVNEGARWLFFRAETAETASLFVTTASGATRSTLLEFQPDTKRLACLIGRDQEPTAPRPNSAFVHFGPDNGYRFDNGSGEPNRPLGDLSDVRLVEAFAVNRQTPAHTLYSRAVEQGRRLSVRDTLRAVVPGLVDLEILTEGENPILHLVFEQGSVPVALSGDGVRCLCQMCLEFAARPRGLVLLEEPEIHLYPRAIRQMARAILSAVRRDIQIVLTTHSLETIDALLTEAQDQALQDEVSIYRFLLDDGLLKWNRHPGSEALFARAQIQEDLR